MAPSGRDHSIGREGRYVIRTIDFEPTRIRRNDFWAQSSTIFCAGLMSAVTFAAALHSPRNDMVVVAGAFDHRAHPIAPARFLVLLLDLQQMASVEERGAPKSCISRTFSDSSHAIS